MLYCYKKGLMELTEEDKLTNNYWRCIRLASVLVMAFTSTLRSLKILWSF